MTIKSIYLAGKMDDPVNGWRNKIIKQSLELPIDYPLEKINKKEFEGFIFEKIPDSIFSNYDYAGPFFIKDMRGPGDFILLNEGHDIYTFEQFGNYYQSMLLFSMLKADLVFAWIDDLTSYQAYVEITMAAALHKKVVIAGVKDIPELWPVYSITDFNVKTIEGLSPELALHQLLCIDEQTSAYFDIEDKLSPIEMQFIDAWLIYNFKDIDNFDPRLKLEVQYEVLDGKYRVDFAHLQSKVVIELDGLEAHKTTDQIAHDRLRQRQIERDGGWRFIRFGGKEVFNDAYYCVSETRDFILNLLDKQL